MNDGPVIPLGFDAMGTTFVIGYALVTIWALVTLAKSATLSGGQRVVWATVIILVPVVGAVAWVVTYSIERSGHKRQI